MLRSALRIMIAGLFIASGVALAATPHASTSPESLVSKYVGAGWGRIFLGCAELALCAWLLSGRWLLLSTAVATVTLGGFTGLILRELTRSNPVPCGCLWGTGSAANSEEVRTGLARSALRNAAMLGSLAFVACGRRTAVGAPCVTRRTPATRGCNTGFSLPEVLVVVGIIAVLVGLLLPVVHHSRAIAARTLCASNLRQLGVAFQTYASANRGFLPRYGNYQGYPYDEWPLWIVAAAQQVSKAKLEWRDLPSVMVLQCPSHPVEGIPSGYVVNAFAFETSPQWDPAPPTQVSKLRNPSSLPWLLEASDAFGPSIYGPFDAVFYEPYHVVRMPESLESRVTYVRHARKTSNLLYADGHVAVVRPGQIQLSDLDDGVRRR